MGASSSTDKKPDLLNRPDAKATDIKLDFANLPKLQKIVDVPKAPQIKTRA